MGSNKSIRVATVVAVVASGLAVGANVGAATERLEVERHCVVEVSGVEDGVLVTAPEVCFSVEAEAAAHAATIGNGAPASERIARSARSSGTNTIGLHYTSRWYGGSSVRVVGTTCGGGVWYPTGQWNNNIESSRHYCGSSPTTFYNYSNCVGSPHRIYQAATTLGSMNNQASCVRYG